MSRRPAGAHLSGDKLRQSDPYCPCTALIFDKRQRNAADSDGNCDITACPNTSAVIAVPSEYKKRGDQQHYPFCSSRDADKFYESIN